MLFVFIDKIKICSLACQDEKITIENLFLKSIDKNKKRGIIKSK